MVRSSLGIPCSLFIYFGTGFLAASDPSANRVYVPCRKSEWRTKAETVMANQTEWFNRKEEPLWQTAGCTATLLHPSRMQAGTHVSGKWVVIIKTRVPSCRVSTFHNVNNKGVQARRMWKQEIPGCLLWVSLQSSLSSSFSSTRPTTPSIPTPLDGCSGRYNSWYTSTWWRWLAAPSVGGR